MTQSIANITTSWIDGTKSYTGIGFNAITIGNSYDGSSRLFKMQVNGNTVFSIDPSGNMFAANLIVANATVDVSGPFNRANQAYLVANAAFDKANTTSGGAAFDKANSANVLAFNTGIGANAYASRVGTSANAYAAALIGGGGYILPQANTTTLGGVKIDGSTITINATGVISSTGGGGGGGGTSTVIGDESLSPSTFYPTFTTTTSGSLVSANVDTINLNYVPSTGTLSSTIFNSLSDITLKDNVEDFNGIEIIKRLHPITFTWKSSGIKSYGVIAQELEKVLPDLVQTTDTGIKSVSYTPIIGILLDVVKRQQNEIETIKKLLNK